MRASLATLLMAAVFAGGLIWAQRSYDGLLDGDSYFHTRAAQQLAEHGVRTRFPQAAFSTWRDRYSDKDFLFHVLLIPFCRDDASLVPGGKRAVMAFDAIFCAALAGAVMALRLRFGPVWIALFFSSWYWMPQHFLSARPQVLAMPLFVLELALLLTGRWRALGATAAVHTLSHSSFALVPMLVLMQGAAHGLRGRPLPWRTLAAVLGGIALAALLHPYFPYNLSVAWDQLVEVARSVWWKRVELPRDVFGGELLGMKPWRLLAQFPAWLPASAGLAAAASSVARPRLSDASATLALTAVGLLALSLLSRRFFPFFAVSSALLAGSVWTGLAGDWSWRGLFARAAGRAWAAVALLALCVAVGQRQSAIWRVPAWGKRVRDASVYQPAVAFLDSVAEPDEQIYHGFWWAFSWLYHYRPDGRYVVGLDPIFLYRFDPRLFARMLEAYRGRGDPYEIIKRDFGARWAFVERLKRTTPMRRQLARHPGIRLRYSDRYAVIYELLDRPEAEP